MAFLKKQAQKILKGEKVTGHFNLIFCDNPYIHHLNLNFRKKNKPTDVLAFIYPNEEIAGEVYISIEKAKTQAPDWGNSYYMELKRLVTHGFLHICGYDHIKAAERKIMESKEQHYLGS